MKYIANTRQLEGAYNFTVTNNLVVGGNLQANSIQAVNINASSITTNTLGAVNITTTTLSTNTLTASTTITAPTISATNTLVAPQILVGNTGFTYNTGSWNPVVQCLRPSGGTLNKENWKDQYLSVGTGYYIKTGNMVTVWFEAACKFDGFQNDFLYSARYPVISGLPFKCLIASTPIDMTFAGATTLVNFPNGYASGVAAPLTITMDGNYIPIVYEEGYAFQGSIPPTYTAGSTWVSDGRTITFSCSQSFYSALDVPAWSLDGTVYNYNVLSTGSGYTAGFRGNLSYFTDE